MQLTIRIEKCLIPTSLESFRETFPSFLLINITETFFKFSCNKRRPSCMYNLPDGINDIEDACTYEDQGADPAAAPFLVAFRSKKCEDACKHKCECVECTDCNEE